MAAIASLGMLSACRSVVHIWESYLTRITTDLYECVSPVGVVLEASRPSVLAVFLAALQFPQARFSAGIEPVTAVVCGHIWQQDERAVCLRLV